MSSLDSTMVGGWSSVYYEADFRRTLEDHLHLLNDKGTLQTRVVTAQMAYRNEFNFYGLLSEIDIPREHQWIVMRVNGLKSPFEYRGTIETVHIPDYVRIETLAKAYRTRKSLI